MDATTLALGTFGALVASVLVKHNQRKTEAICVFDRAVSTVYGHVAMRSRGHATEFVCHLTNLPPGAHGFHVHRSGNLLHGCKSTCDHYNPENKSHGGPRGRRRHRGDLGNIYADADGTCQDVVVADVGLDEIIGRALIVHADPDDLGQGTDAESLKTGNAGARIGCGVIGLI